MLLYFEDDIICYISKELPLHLVKKLLATNKYIHSIHRKVITCNKEFLKYRAFDACNNYLSIMKNSTIVFDYDRHFDLFKVAYDDNCLYRICNTTQIISFAVFCNSEMKVQAQTFLSHYYAKKIFDLFNYDIEDPKYTSCFYNFNSIFQYPWYLLNIELFDIYQIMFHIYSNNYDGLLQIMSDLHFVKSADTFSTFSVLVQFYNSFGETYLDTHVKIIIIYIMYATAHYVGAENLRNNQKLWKTLHAKTAYFLEEIKHIKHLPRKIKRKIRNKITFVANKL